MSASGLSKTRLSRVSDAMRGYVERGEVAGVVSLICRHGEVHVGTAGVRDLDSRKPMRGDTIFRVMSMTKSVLAAAAMILVEEGRLKLDAPLDAWLPELAHRKVLRSLASELDDVVPAKRAVTLRDLLTLRMGLGAIMAPPDSYPIQHAMAKAEIAPGPDPVPWAPDEFMRHIGSVPLAHQPGEGWLYHTGFDVLSVLLARVADEPLEEFLTERIFSPLAMKDTAFSVTAGKLDRLSTAYKRDAKGGLAVYDSARGGHYGSAPVFPSELASTADDFLTFALMLLNQGRHGRKRILARPTVELMCMDHITQAQKNAWPFSPGFWDANGWGFGVSVITRRNDIAATPGRYGWVGGLGTAWFSDPREDMVCLLLTQRMMETPDDTAIIDDFLTLAYQAIDD